jgi:hypothetical protein
LLIQEVLPPTPPDSLDLCFGRANWGAWRTLSMSSVDYLERSMEGRQSLCAGVALTPRNNNKSSAHRGAEKRQSVLMECPWQGSLSPWNHVSLGHSPPSGPRISASGARAAGVAGRFISTSSLLSALITDHWSLITAQGGARQCNSQGSGSASGGSGKP